MTTLAEKMNTLPEERRRKIEALAEELRTEQREALLQEALARPSVDEIMRAYEGWLEQMALFHRAQPVPRPPVPVTTNHSNGPRPMNRSTNA